MPHVLLPLQAHVFVLLQQFQRQADQIVKVHALVGGEAFFVTRHDARGDAFVVCRGLGLGHGGIQPLVLPCADCPLPLPCGGQVRAAACIFQDRRHIIGVKNAEIFLQSQRFTALSQHAHAQRVERTNQDFLRFAPDQLLGAFAHFSRGFVGESDGGDALGLQPQLNQMRDFVRDDAGFAGAGTGQHQTRTLDMVNRFELGEIE